MTEWVNRASVVIALSVALGLTGCNKSESKGDGGGGGGAAGSSAPVTGTIHGKVTGEDGKPISAPGATVMVTIDGVGAKSAERINYNAGVKPDGTYSQKLADGSYHSEATLELTWNGKVYHIRLHPVQNNRVDQESTAGIQQDFVWKLTGPRPNGNGTYGPNFHLLYEFYRDDLKKSVPPPPPGTKFVFTLTPKGPRIDGAPTQPITFERTPDKLDDQKDIPVAIYTVTGTEVAPDGTKKPLVVRNPGLTKYADSCETTFEPGSVLINGYENTTVDFSRKLN
jgi:hypothetical protein